MTDEVANRMIKSIEAIVNNAIDVCNSAKTTDDETQVAVNAKSLIQLRISLEAFSKNNKPSIILLS